MKNMVYGVMGIRVRNGMFNAAWDKYPVRDAKDNIIASPYALQYCMKEEWKRRGSNVLGLKEVKEDGTYCTLKGKYELMFGKKSKKTDTLNNLLGCKDVLNFGVVYTEKPNIAIRGTVQFSTGINKYKDTEILERTVLSPYASDEGKSMTTNGEEIFLDEAHYIYDYVLNPNEYDQYINDEFEGYTEKHYEDFKETSLVAVTKTNSKTKKGCYNEFALFIKMKEDICFLALNDLQQYIEVYKEENKIIYDLTTLSSILNKIKDKIESVEMYYLDNVINIKGWSFENTNMRDILTRGVL